MVKSCKGQVMKKFTHTGLYKNPIGGTYKLHLRETEELWVSHQGEKYHKHNGHLVGEKYPMGGLVLCSIKIIEGAKQ